MFKNTFETFFLKLCIVSDNKVVRVHQALNLLYLPDSLNHDCEYHCVCKENVLVTTNLKKIVQIDSHTTEEACKHISNFVKIVSK